MCHVAAKATRNRFSGDKFASVMALYFVPFSWLFRGPADALELSFAGEACCSLHRPPARRGAATAAVLGRTRPPLH